MEQHVTERTRRLYSDCVACMLRNQAKNYPPDAPEDRKVAWSVALCRLMGEATATTCTLEIMHRLYAVQDELFPGWRRDYTGEKDRFNRIMLTQEDWVRERIRGSADPLRTAIQYAMMGNYIDFTSVSNVNEAELKRMLSSAEETEVDDAVLRRLKDRLRKAKSVVLLADNCGEIVMDKLLLEVVRGMTEGSLTAIVKGADVENDATMADARQTGLDRVARVMGHGTDYAGFHPNHIDDAAFAALTGADVVIAKGMANLETLFGFGYPIFYIFLCKCDLFARRFSARLMQGMLADEETIGNMDWVLRV